jgi:predicted ester cyclase
MEDHMSVEQNKLAFRNIPEKIMNTGDFSLAGEYLAPGFVDHVPLPEGVPTGIAGFEMFVRELRNAFPDYKATVTHILGDGDEVAGRLVCRGTHLGSFFGVPASGKLIEWTESHFGRFENGKLVEHWMNADDLGMLRQMGVAEDVQMPDPAAARTTAEG